MRHPSGDTQQFTLGFSWGACILGPFWALYRRLWEVLVTLVLYLAYMINCGVYGSRWRKWTLERRGYVVDAGP
jgi:hypothetical protein